ncbi:MAG: hypothetical protein HXS47_10155 [Theionarchaea archaeon]|nr:hypothetical protein [Theionarchaea archaeon]
MVSHKKVGGFLVFWFGFFFTMGTGLFLYYMGNPGRWIVLPVLGVYVMIHGFYMMTGSKFS